MQELKKLPVGFENFQEIRKLDFYYVDKTKLVKWIYLPDHADLEKP